MVLSWRQLASLLGPPGPMPPLVALLATPQVGEQRILLRATDALTLLRLDAVLSGGTNPSISVALLHAADVSAAGTAATTDPMNVSSITSGTTVTSFQSADIPSGHWVWLEIMAVSGSPAGLTVSTVFK